MAVRGPKPKPKPLQPGETRIEIELAEVPEPPAWLLKEARAEWKRLAPRLVKQGLLSTFDRGAFAAYCQAFGTVEALETELAKIRKRDNDPTAGIVTKTAGGNLVHHPLGSSIRQARAEMVKIAAEFGLTPSSRARLDTDAAKQRGGGSKKARFFEAKAND